MIIIIMIIIIPFRILRPLVLQEHGELLQEPLHLGSHPTNCIVLFSEQRI